MKKIIVLAFCFTLPACVAPPALTVASLALSGVSFVQTGKTLPDHALSSVAQRDCIMFRATRGEQICQTEMAFPDGAIVAAAGPPDAAGTPWPEEITAVPAPIDRVPPQEPLPVQPVQVASLAPIALSAQPARGAPRTTVLPETQVIPTSAAAVTPNPTDEASPVARPARTPSSLADDAARSTDKTVTVDHLPTRAPRGTRAGTDTAKIDTPPTERRRHLVVGSFRDRTRAAAHIHRLGGKDLHVVTATVKGREQYRVVAGPFADADIDAAKRDFAARGVKGAWPIKLRATSKGFQVAAR